MTEITKIEFQHLFTDALELAALIAEQHVRHKVPRNFVIHLHGAGHSGDYLTPEAALDELYITKDKFYKIIDVSVTQVSGQTSTVFVRASSHTPVPFEQTWNYPIGTGPFKQLIAEEIKMAV